MCGRTGKEMLKFDISFIDKANFLVPIRIIKSINNSNICKTDQVYKMLSKF